MKTKKKVFPYKLKDFNLDNAASKEAYNKELFTVVAQVYPVITRLLSFGRDSAWKKKLLRLLPTPPNTSSAPAAVRILDLACGNGDITKLLAEQYPQAELRGIDLNPAMLALARQRFKDISNLVTFHEESMLALSAPAEYFDIITGGYALRNAPDLSKTLEEIKRVLKTGGTAAFLDFSKSQVFLLQLVQIRLLRFWGRLWGWFFHRNPEVYGYIAESLKQFPDRKAWLQLLYKQDFKNIRIQELFGGFVCLTILTK
jgi:demethylmenaquinone methyltransferase/2-methoxy-6-polyprenyl-1,4-benzoquinol methylase